MSGVQFNLERSIEPFFGFDKRALHFFNSNYFHTNYEGCVNTEANPAGLLTNRAEYVMLAQNYKTINGYNPNPLDVHFQYTDFIVKTALFHREIDRSVLMGSGIAKFKTSFENGINEALNQSINDVMRDTRAGAAPLPRSGINNRGFLKLNRNGDNGDITFGQMGLQNNSTFFDFIVANLFTLAKQYNDMRIFAGAIDGLDVHQDRLDIRNTNLIARIGVAGAPLPPPAAEGHRDAPEHLGDVIRRFVGNCDVAGVLAPAGLPRPVGNYCLASYFNDRAPGRRVSESAEAIRALADKVDPVNADARIANVLNSISNVFVDCTLALAKDIFAVESIANVSDLFNADATIQVNVDAVRDTFQRVLREVRANGTFDRYRRCLADTVFTNIKTLMTPLARGQHFGINNNEWTTQVVENVFDVWPQLDARARAFYGKHLHIFGQSGARVGAIGAAGHPADEDVDLMRNGNFNGIAAAAGRAGLRLNLMKGKNMINVLFGDTLPWLPVADPTGNGMEVKNVWYTDALTKKPEKFTAQVDSIRRLYNDMYLNAAFSPAPGSANLNLPQTYDAATHLYQNVDFDIDDMAIIHNQIKRKENVEAPATKPTFDELLEDLTTHEIYGRDNNGKLYTMVNGVKSYVESVTDANCAGTGLNAGSDNARCVRFVSRCLLSGNKDELAACLEEMKDYDLFSVAHKDLTINPEMAVKILEVFGVGGRQVKNMYIVESLDEWIEREVKRWKNPDSRNSILGNRQLKDYLCGVIDFVNSHPAIMNNGMAESDYSGANDNVHEEDRRMNKGLFHRPSVGSSAGKLFDGIGLGRYANYRDALPPMLTGMTNADVYSNTLRGQIFSGMGFIGPGVMVGGNRVWEETLEKRHSNKDSDSDLLWGLFNNVIGDMKRAGLPLNKNDETSLLEGLEKLKKNEIKLGKLYVMLRTLVDLLEFFKNSCCETVTMPKNISVSQIRNRQDTIAFLKNAVCDMEECISKNAKSQNNVCNNMIKHFGTLFETIGNH